MITMGHFWSLNEVSVGLAFIDSDMSAIEKGHMVEALTKSREDRVDNHALCFESLDESIVLVDTFSLRFGSPSSFLLPRYLSLSRYFQMAFKNNYSASAVQIIVFMENNTINAKNYCVSQTFYRTFSIAGIAKTL